MVNAFLRFYTESSGPVKRGKGYAWYQTLTVIDYILTTIFYWLYFDWKTCLLIDWNIITCDK